MHKFLNSHRSNLYFFENYNYTMIKNHNLLSKVIRIATSELFDITHLYDDNHYIIRNVIINSDINLLEFILYINVYPKLYSLLQNDLIKETISMFAENDVLVVLNKYYDCEIFDYI